MPDLDRAGDVGPDVVARTRVAVGGIAGSRLPFVVEMTLPDPGAVPPIVLLLETLNDDARRLPATPAVPAALMPM